MRDTVQEILFGVSGQTLWMDAPEGRPSSITSVTVYRYDVDDGGDDESAVSATAIDSVNTDTTAAAGYGETDPTLLTLSSGTGVTIGRDYLLADANGGGASEWVTIADVDGTLAHTRSPLINSYSSGATLKSARMTATVDATWAATSSKISDEGTLSDLRAAIEGTPLRTEYDAEPRYRAVFVYVVNSVTCRREIRFDLVRYSAQHSILPTDVDAVYPGWLDRLPLDYRKDQGRSLISDAYRAVRLDMRADGNAARWLRSPDVVGELVIMRSQVTALERSILHGNADDLALNTARKLYEARYNQLVRGPHVEIGTAPGGAIIGGRPRGAFGRR